MDPAATFTELFGRIPPIAHEAVDGLSVEQLTTCVLPGANTIAWLVWHTARIQDHHGAELLDVEQMWVADPSWSDAFGLAPDGSNTGYGHTAAEAGAIRSRDAMSLVQYLDAVHARNAAILDGLSAADLDRIVDRRWDPPVTLGVRLVSIADDGLQHMGQAAYVRGVLER